MTVETAESKSPVRVTAGSGHIVGTLRTRHIIWLLALGSIWGSSYLFIKLLVDAVDPASIIAVRLALGAVTLGAVQVFRGRGLPAPGAIWLHLLIMSVVGNLLPFWLIAWSQQHTTSAMAAVLNATIPLFTMVIAVLAFHYERFTANRLAGIALGLIGVALLTGTSIVDLSDAAGLGELALLGASSCYGFAFAYARRYVRGDPVANVTAQLLIGLLFITPLALVTGWIHPNRLDVVDIGGWIVLSAVGTGLAYILYYSLISEIGATAASFVTYIIPVVGVILGWVFLDEQLGASGFAGMALVIAGVAVSYGWHRRFRNRLAPAGDSSYGP